MRKILYIIIFCGVLFTSCEDFLDKVPDNRTQAKTSEDYAEVLVKAYPSGCYFSFANAMSDNVEDAGKDAIYQKINEQFYKYAEVTSDNTDTPTNYWNACYEAIAHSNLVLSDLRERFPSIDVLPKEYENNYGEALVSRAYAHFMLVSLWAKPYNSTSAATDLGIPWVDKSEDIVIKEYKRESVQKIYDNVVRDLEEGIKFIRDEDYSIPKYHFNLAAAHTFASRVYLMLANWDKVLEHSNKALGMKYDSKLKAWNGALGSLSEANLKVKYSSSTEKSNLLISSNISVWSRYFSFLRYGLGAEKLKLLTAPSVCGKSSKYQILTYSSFPRSFIPKFAENFRYLGLNAETGWIYTTQVLLSIEEALFNKIEANIMLEKYVDASSDLDIFFSKRVKNYDAIANKVTDANVKAFSDVDPIVPKPFYQLKEMQVAYLKCLLRQRRIDFMFEGMRWFDIRRFNIPVIHEDRDGVEYKLEEQDNKKLLAIPETAISFGLKANPR